jgi:hypothetical protein
MNKMTLTHRFIRGLHLLVIAALLAGLALGLSPAPVAYAATITVTTTLGGTGGPECTLRDAITAANTDTATGGCPAGSGADIIELAAGATYTLTAVDNNTDGPNGLPSVTSEITINGNGATIERSSAGATPDFRIFHVGDAGNLTLNDLTINNGKTPDGTDAGPGDDGGDGGYGGGIYSEGDLTLTNCTVRGNSTGDGGNGGDDGGDGGYGGGIYSEGDLTLTSCTVRANSTGDGGNGGDDGGNDGGRGGSGGGIYNSSDTLTITNSTVRGNSTGNGGDGGDDNRTGRGGSGGGIYNSKGTLTITNCTVSDNRTGNGGDGGGYGGSGGSGGGIYHYRGTLTITNSTVSDNRTGNGGDGEDDGGDGGSGGGISLGTTCCTPTLLMMTNCTVSGNTTGDGGEGSQPGSGGSGGGIRVSANNFNATIDLSSCTVADNAAASGGMCIHIFFSFRTANLTLKNTILTSGGANFATSGSGGTVNLTRDYTIANDATLSDTGTGNQNDTDPQLAPLANNGGPTQTHALLTGSPALDTGSPDCPPPGTDQRGVSRPQPAAGGCDIGAYEAGPPILRVSKAGSGDGTVTSNVAGINCGTDCAEWYDEDTAVTLTATPAGGSVFAGWSGDCSGSNPSTTVTMGADKACTATFNQAQPPLPVGGLIVPVSKLGLLGPWVGLAALASLAALIVALVRRRKITTK